MSGNKDLRRAKHEAYQKKHTALKLIRMLVVVYFGNLLGSLMLTCIDYVSGQYNYSSDRSGYFSASIR